MKPIHKILLTTDGSITVILEALSGKEIKVETVKQRVIQADETTANLLHIEKGGRVNYRIVNLKGGKEILAHAVSYTPLKRLGESFKDDLMKADIPIGKIINNHKLEVRREINWGKVESAGELAGVFDISKNDSILSRNYNVIHKNNILINITEYFPYSAF